MYLIQLVRSPQLPNFIDNASKKVYSIICAIAGKRLFSFWNKYIYQKASNIFRI